MHLDDILVSFIVNLISGVMVTYCYDNILRNKRNEPAYLFSDKLFIVNKNREYVTDNDKRKSNRQLALDVFFVIFTMYLIWASLYLPFVFKAGIIPNIIDLSKSNFVNIFGISNYHLILELKTLRWICLFVALVLYFPALYVGTIFSKIFIHFKDQFYEVTEQDWRRYRFYGVICFITFILGLHIYFISIMPLWNSLTVAIGIVAAFIAKANSDK
ncbi:hypothetical protein SJPD1_0979 [Sulfurospirillum diekertiae]|uniref:Uncharacterized protein n=1 Tax=Sulfurospirillum diekertiae TaxID=1854492 RepID=A0A290HCY9_9BACT|nr:hypothetical protein [Sulfurospirillum diekertiae]ATB69091.1 hypothetical protein SJPD1_0979 [Sulfurospirillum diekertiae]